MQTSQTTTLPALNAALYLEGQVPCRFSAPKQNLLQRKLKTGYYRITDLGLEKKCNQCKTYWPADSDFFGGNSQGDKLNNRCHDCQTQHDYPHGRSSRGRIGGAKKVATLPQAVTQ